MKIIQCIQNWVKNKVVRWGELKTLNQFLKEGELYRCFDFVDEIMFITRGGHKGMIRYSKHIHDSNTETHLTGKLKIRRHPCKTTTWNMRGHYVRMGTNPHHIYDIDRIIGYIKK